MNDFTLDNVNEMYIDVLREIGNIGAGNATTSLASMINECSESRIDGSF